MTRKLILVNPDRVDKYWTGRWWDNSYSKEIKDAKQFNNESEISNEIHPREDDENYKLMDLMEEISILEVQTIYVKD